ncbi:beta-ketoacyl synthase chain length factor [Flavihumibacter fluvii]|uniref:beta-ketoacyl synthase chain length factor n=1 Tax=Flavihumibacter fluvii TaxID=2838157 RepID=UPI001BDF0CD1|nr:beta-ketoacyl synthase chain length factor [Flavihumibacter fluvii]ULQ51470.1 beta-ketoacyl synthase chain length factor [Flavihumibacter fluvii]
MYINAASAISPQPVFRQPDLLKTPKALIGPRYTCTEPDYSLLIEPKLIRRMSRIIRMGVATAMDALQQAGVKDPSAILTGTAYGCLEDTGIFLRRMVENKEEMLTPTAFIQSTHNTVGAQVALLLKCHSYNNTYVQRAHSFESALLDAWLLLLEDKNAAVLVGAADETTNESFTILQRFGLFRNQPSGEGACYFVAESVQKPGSYAKFGGLRTLLQPEELQVNQAIHELLAENNLQTSSVDLLLSGKTAADTADVFYGMVEKAIFSATPTGYYTALCGVYPTAASFACWLAASMLKHQEVPAVLLPQYSGPIRNVLIYTKDDAGYHSLMLLKAC